MKPFRFTVTIIALISIFGLTSRIQANNLESSDTSEKAEIQSVIEQYFDARYRSFGSLDLEDLSPMMENSPQSSSFLNSESDKLKIEIQHAKLNKLGYAEYKYFLDFTEILVDASSQTATASIFEGHDVVFEISKEISPLQPVVSTMRNLQHTIGLRKVHGQWKIFSDNYDDYLWRLLKSTKISTDELFRFLEESQKETELGGNVVQSLTACSLPNDESSHSYNRSGAVAYAHNWATTQRPYNTKYYDFTDFGGDCTNFVNQAIRESSDAEIVFGGLHGYGSYGWYFYSSSDYANAWTFVQPLYEFITQYWVWPRPGIDDPEGPGGPEGCEMTQNDVYEGDLIQYDWTNDGSWEHSAIIVMSQDLAQNYRFHWVAGHTPDVDNYPFTSFDYPNKVYRFIHVERIDGYVHIYLPIFIKQGEGDGGAGAAMNPQQNPYPAPLVDPVGVGEMSTPLPYPAP